MRGNGFAWGQLSHLLAWVLQITGLRPVDVSCSMVFSTRSGADMHDAAVFSCENGASISLTGTGAVPGNAHGDDSDESHPHSGKHVSVRVFGDEGSLVYEGDDQDPSSGDLVVLTRSGDRKVEKGFLFGNYEDTGTGRSPSGVHQAPVEDGAFPGHRRGARPGCRAVHRGHVRRRRTGEARRFGATGVNGDRLNAYGRRPPVPRPAPPPRSAPPSRTAPPSRPRAPVPSRPRRRRRRRAARRAVGRSPSRGRVHL